MATVTRAVINPPEDPMLRERIEEQRRYLEQQKLAQEARANQEWRQRQQYSDRIADVNREGLYGRQDALYDRTRADRRADYRTARDDKHDYERRLREEQQLKFDELQTQLQTEIGPLRKRLGDIANARDRLKATVMVSHPRGQTTPEALKNTKAFNMHFKAANGIGPGVTLTEKAMSSHVGMLQWLTENGAKDQLLAAYTREWEGEEKRLMGPGTVLGDKLNRLRATENQLLKRQDLITQKLQTMDYGNFDVAQETSPLVDYNNLTAATPEDVTALAKTFSSKKPPPGVDLQEQGELQSVFGSPTEAEKGSKFEGDPYASGKPTDDYSLIEDWADEAFGEYQHPFAMYDPEDYTTMMDGVGRLAEEAMGSNDADYIDYVIGQIEDGKRKVNRAAKAAADARGESAKELPGGSEEWFGNRAARGFADIVGAFEPQGTGGGLLAPGIRNALGSQNAEDLESEKEVQTHMRASAMRDLSAVQQHLQDRLQILSGNTQAQAGLSGQVNVTPNYSSMPPPQGIPPPPPPGQPPGQPPPPDFQPPR